VRALVELNWTAVARTVPDYVMPRAGFARASTRSPVDVDWNG
jgi:hypothetical protein